MTSKISDTNSLSSLFTNQNNFANTPERVLVTLSGVNASSDEEAEALLKALGFTKADLDAYKEKYGKDLKKFFADEFASKTSRITKDASSKPGFQAYIGINRQNYKFLTGFIAERRTAARKNIPPDNSTNGGAAEKRVYDNSALQAKKLRDLAEKAGIETTSVGQANRLDERRHFSVSVPSGTKNSDADTVLAALIEKEFGDRITFAENRDQILNIAKQSGVAPKNISVSGNRAEFDLTLEDTLKLKIAYNFIQDGLNRADAARLDFANNNMFSQFVAGMFEGAKDSVVGTAEIILDPVSTAKALWQVVGSPVETFNALYGELEKSWDKFKNADYIERSRMIGHLVGSVVTGILIGKGAGELGNILKATKTGAALIEKANLLKSAAVIKVAEKFTDEAASLAKSNFFKRLETLGVRPNNFTNIAFDPELWASASKVAGNLIGKGYAKFGDFAAQIRKELGNLSDEVVGKLYREQIISLDLSKGKQIISSSGKAIDEATVKEAKEKVFDLVKNNKSVELDNYLEQIKNKYGTDFLKELKETRTGYVENLYETGRRNIDVHDLFGGHNREQHIGRSENWLRNRLDTDPSLKDTKYASSFRNEEVANRVLGKFVKQYEKELETFLKTPNKGKLEIVFETGEPSLGLGVKRGKSGTWDSTRAYVMIVKDTSEKGWYIHTTYPTLAKSGVN